MNEEPKQLLIWDVNRRDLSFSLLPYYTPDFHAVLAQGKTIYSLSVGQFRLIDGLIHLHMKRMQELTAEAPEMAVKEWIHDNWDQLSSLPCKRCGATPIDRNCSASERELICEQCFFKL